MKVLVNTDLVNTLSVNFFNNISRINYKVCISNMTIIESKDEIIYLYEFNQSISDGCCRGSWSISWFIIWKPTNNKTSSESLLTYINLSLVIIAKGILR